MKIFKWTNIIKIISALMALVICVSLAPDVSALDDPDIKAAAALLVDVESGSVLYANNEYERRAPASLTKIMTVMLAIEAYNRGEVALNDIVSVSDDAYTGIEAGGSTAGLKTGEELTFEQLLYLAMLASANESCNVLAEYVAGDIPTFVELMNTRATELGCTDTHFANTHGMPNDDHYSTAHDLYLIAKNALDISLFRRIVSTPDYTVPATNMSDERVLHTTNYLLRKNSPYYYEFASGVKTGHTESAGYCLLSTATQDGRTLISVVLGAQSVVIEDGTTQVQSFSESKRLLQWGFANFSYQELLSTIDLIGEIPVRLGRGTNSVVLRPYEGVKALLPNDTDLSKVVLKPHIYAEEELTAPVEQGTVLGDLTVSLDGVIYGTVRLVANTTVELNRTAYITSEVKDTLANKYVRLVIITLFVLLAIYIVFIIYHNISRRRKKQAATELARRRIEEYMRNEGASTGKSFEEIEARHRDRELHK